MHRCRIMGILNVTPDSFSDGGAFEDVDAAVTRAWEMVDQGADILDIGAESSRPGAEPVPADEEIKRLEPIIKQLQEDQFPLPISLDTYKPEVLAHFLETQSIQMANDITGLRNLQMIEVIRGARIPVVVMHMFGNPQKMQEDYAYDDVVSDLLTYFQERIDQYGLEDNVILDPGIGFGKSVAHNLRLIDELDQFHQLQMPLLLGASRKSFIGKCLDLDVHERLIPSLAVAALAADKGCQILRVHDVLETRQVVNMVGSIQSSGMGQNE